MNRSILLTLATLALVACGGGSDGAESSENSVAENESVIEGPSGAQFADACGEQLNVPDAICTCIGEKAETDLTAEERSFAYASITKDAATAEKIRTELGVESAMKAGMFMVNAPAACASENPAE